MTGNTNAADLRLVGTVPDDVIELIADFAASCEPIEQEPLLVLRDNATNAIFLEVHVRGSRLVELATVDVPLDPDEQGEYRANREIVEDHVAFAKMKEDALKARSFSNIVCEYTRTFEPSRPLKVIGGQHRFSAIQEAWSEGVDEHHGVKLYFGLDSEQRLDVQMISNTNIAVSTDLFDRMSETLSGPQLRQWCQSVGLLGEGEDFADKRARGNPVTVRAARTFIVNYYRGSEVDARKFDSTATTPTLLKSGVEVDEWEQLKHTRPTLWEDASLLTAGKEFAHLVSVQREAFVDKRGKVLAGKADAAEKALNYAVLSAWAFVAGVLRSNKTRLKRHFGLSRKKSGDPLNAAALAKGRHKTDPENYRGLGYRTDAKERSRLVELFFLQAEDGAQITAPKVDLAIKKAVAKEAALEVASAKGS